MKAKSKNILDIRFEIGSSSSSSSSSSNLFIHISQMIITRFNVNVPD